MPRNLLVLAVLLVARAAPAQDGVTLRYAPTPGATARLLTEIRTTTSLTGFPAVPDGATVITETRVNATQRVLDVAPGGWLVEVVVDSVRARRRSEGAAWVDAVDTGMVGRAARAVISDRFEVTGIRTTGPTDGEVLRLLGAGVAGLGFAFPVNPVPAGTTFASGGRVYARAHAGLETGIALDETAFADLSLTLDSAVAEGGDELVYFHFRAPMTPRTVGRESEDGNQVVTLSGGAAGRLVWSRAWNAFVGGATRLRVEGTIRARTPTGAVDARAGWDTTILHQLRP
ncbi:MAG: hypothetical protein OER21_05890 [Gemmatimonadota bacterium]|nr:hypothetical protein [Gemmatimonadota bacterium]